MAFTKFTITAADKKCNDGSNYIYYKRAGTGEAANTFIIYMMGGGFCRDFGTGDIWDCDDRTAQQTGSAGWPASLPDSSFLYGILSNDPSENPHFYEATHFYFPYLTSDAWMGTDQDPISTWYFHGQNIARYILDELITNHGLDNTKTLIICGDSAGAVGIYHTLPTWYSDHFATGQDLAGIEWYAVPVSGWLIDPGTLDELDPSFQEILTDAIALWTADSPYMAEAEFIGNEWEAFKSARFWPYVDDAIRDQLLVINAIPDAIPTNFSQIDLAIPMPAPELAFLQSIADTMATQLNDLPRVFAPAEVTDVDSVATPIHAMCLLPAFTRQRVNCRSVNWAIQQLLANRLFAIVQEWDGTFKDENIVGNGTTTPLTAPPSLNITRTVTFQQVISNLGFPIDWKTTYLTIKAAPTDLDAAAIIQIRASNPEGPSDGLTTLNGAPATDPTGACLILDMDNAQATISIHYDITTQLSLISKLYWDMKTYNENDTTVLLTVTGSGKITDPITLSV